MSINEFQYDNYFIRLNIMNEVSYGKHNSLNSANQENLVSISKPKMREV